MKMHKLTSENTFQNNFVKQTVSKLYCPRDFCNQLYTFLSKTRTLPSKEVLFQKKLFLKCLAYSTNYPHCEKFRLYINTYI